MLMGSIEPFVWVKVEKNVPVLCTSSSSHFVTVSCAQLAKRHKKGIYRCHNYHPYQVSLGIKNCLQNSMQYTSPPSEHRHKVYGFPFNDWFSPSLIISFASVLQNVTLENVFCPSLQDTDKAVDS